MSRAAVADPSAIGGCGERQHAVLEAHCGGRPAEEVPLPEPHAAIGEVPALLQGLDPLSHDVHAQASCDLDHRVDDAVVPGKPRHERSIDLQQVRTDLVEPRERRVAGADVVDPRGAARPPRTSPRSRRRRPGWSRSADGRTATHRRSSRPPWPRTSSPPTTRHEIEKDRSCPDSVRFEPSLSAPSPVRRFARRRVRMCGGPDT